MKQWMMLIVVLSLFFVVWGGVLYQIFMKQEPNLNASLASEILLEEKIKDLPSEDFISNRGNINENFPKNHPINNTRKHTEENKQMNPPIIEGIDFGEGVSIDDLLENYGVIMSN